MDQAVLLRELADLQEWQNWATGHIDRLRGRILELEERLLDTDKVATREIARLKRDAAWRMDLVPLAIKVAEHRRARILELEDQLVDAKLELRLKDVQNQV